MKALFILLSALVITSQIKSQPIIDTLSEMKSLDKATAAIRSAFEKGDAELVASLHSPSIIKYFGGSNVVIGRPALEKGLDQWFRNAKVEFIENKVESTVFCGETAIQTVIFAIKSTPKNGGKSNISRGRSMVVYARDKSSPTGWFSLREMAQEAPLDPEH